MFGGLVAYVWWISGIILQCSSAKELRNQLPHTAV